MTNLSAVQWMSIEDVAELWAPELRLPKGIVAQELRLAAFKLKARSTAADFQTAYDRFKTPLSVFPQDSELPSLQTKIDREFIRQFCGKQTWLLPKFWFSRAASEPSFAGRPSKMAAVISELHRRNAKGELVGSLATQAKALAEWARTQFPGEQTPTAKTIENNIRTIYRELRAIK